MSEARKKSRASDNFAIKRDENFAIKKGANAALKKDETVVIKKYANRRLYNTDTSTYITLEDLCGMVKKGIDFIVQDARSGEDLTRQILTQIIFEQESKGYALLPINFLRSVIGFYDDSISGLLPHYLEASMDSFTQNQEKMREYTTTHLGNFSPFTQFKEISKQQMEFLAKTFSLFAPFDGYFKESTPTRKASGGK